MFYVSVSMTEQCFSPVNVFSIPSETRFILENSDN